MNYEGHKAFALTSPLMHELGEHVIRECPTGHVLREAPHIYRAIAASSHVENGAVDPYTLSAWVRDAMGVVGSERTRLRAIEDDNREMDRDRGAGRRALKVA